MAYDVQLDLNSDDIKDLVYVKTNVGGWFFDAFLEIDYQESVQIADHPVAEGANITDHAFIQPKVLQMRIGMSDVEESFVAGQFADSWSRSNAGWKVLQQLKNDRMPLQILTRLGLYENMLIESISAHDTYETQYSLFADVVFREIIIATVSEVEVSYEINTSNTTDASITAPTVKQGTVQPTQTTVDEDKKSALFNITGRQII